MKVKVFTISATYFGKFSNTGAKLEREINAWLAQNPAIRVINVTHSSSGGSLEPANIVVTLWYHEQPG